MLNCYCYLWIQLEVVLKGIPVNFTIIDTEQTIVIIFKVPTVASFQVLFWPLKDDHKNYLLVYALKSLGLIYPYQIFLKQVFTWHMRIMDCLLLIDIGFINDSSVVTNYDVFSFRNYCFP